MSAGSIVGGGIRLVRTQPKTIAIWTGLYAVAMLAVMIASRPWIAAAMAFQQQAAANAAAGTPPSLPAGWITLLFVFQLLFLIGAVIAFAAVVRAVARPGGDRFAYIRVGMDELRLIGLCVLFGIAAIVAEIVAGLAIVLVGVLVSLVAGKAAAFAVAAILVLALLGGAIYVEVRLSLAGALTVMRRKIVIGAAWRATRGHFWSLFGAYALLAIALFAMTIVVVALTEPHLLAAYARLDPQAIEAAGQEQLARQGQGLSAAMIVQLVIGAMFGVVAGAVTCGAVATAAIELGDPATVDDRG